MRAPVDVDCAIVGAGCAGLSLAVHLLEEGPPGLRVALLEPRTEYRRDRTWCFWDVDPHPFQHRVTHRWARWRVRTATGAHVAASSKHTYGHLPSDAFYEEALARIDRSDRIRLHRGVTVHELQPRPDRVRVESSQGGLWADVVFDTRPPRFAGDPPAGEVRLLQHFRGWHVRTDSPAFDPGTCTLMDFDVDQHDGIHFVYLLPLDPCHALVEDTWFTPGTWPPDRYERELARYMRHRFGGVRHEVLGREGGVLPMTTEPFPVADGPRVLRAGLAGGLAKPSTGYAFVFIQRHARALARAMRRGLPPAPPAVRPGWTRMLDRTFLKVLSERPREAPALFLRLFERTPPDVLVRFLSEASDLRDDLRVMASLPAAPFAGAAWRARRLWLRGS
ncbi:MAG: lycopene cyclase family protein [Myxococcota bacterium]